MSTSTLRSLERIHRQYGDGVAARKAGLLDRLAGERLPSAAAVHRLHEVLCFLHAYPDDAAVLAHVERMLGDFERRPDLRRHAEALQDSGIAGTPTIYRFFFETAQWLATRWPERLTVRWPDLEAPERLERALSLLVTPAEQAGLDEIAFPLKEWVRRLKGEAEADGAFLVRRFAALAADPFIRQYLYETLGFWLRLEAGPDTPSRTRAKLPRRAVHWQRGPVTGPRPDLHAELKRPPLAVRTVSRRQAERLLDMAREAMVTRGRDLDAFAYGSPDDVRMVDCGDGLEFVAIGQVPERRLLCEAVYGFLTLKNGVPIGYVLNSALYGSAEIAYNVFDTYRGAEAAPVYARVLAMVHDLFGADTFTIYPYQLGHENDEALESGAWWFYQKLGFRARDPEVLALMDRELERMRHRPGHRSSIETLRRLSTVNVYLQTGRQREDVIGIVPLPNVGLAVTEYVSARFGADREAAARACSSDAMRRLGLRSLGGFSAGERMAWEWWAPVVCCLSGVERWSAANKRAAVAVIRAKGGRRESDFVRRFDAHGPLRRAVRRLAERME
ncbi:MAG: hypothetical protein PVH00_06625 [Gemmatimonadota bacterium]|jgi:hypothetical protein